MQPRQWLASHLALQDKVIDRVYCGRVGAVRGNIVCMRVRQMRHRVLERLRHESLCQSTGAGTAAGMCVLHQLRLQQLPCNHQ